MTWTDDSKLLTRALPGAALATLTTLALAGCPADDSDSDDEVGGSCDLGLLPGDLVISEIMIDSEGRQWFEVYNASGDAVNLEGLVLAYTKDDGTGRQEHVVASSVDVPAGGYVVLGDVLPEVAAMTDHLDYGWAGELGDFVNSAGSLLVECGDSVIDQAYYVEPTSGTARAFDGALAPDAVANDDQGNWCDSSTPFDAGGDESFGTPGAANDVCGGADTCLEGGVPVDVVRPAAGELVITEVHANPDIVGDSEGEWFELLVLADVHLNGLTIGRDPEDEAEDVVAFADCVGVSAGESIVIARSADPVINGGLPAEVVVWETDVSLTNNDGSLWVGNDVEILDVVTWSSAPTGASTQLDPDVSDPTANDDLGNWCDATVAYGDGDLGSPGSPNEQCAIEPPEGQCFDLDDGAFRDVAPVEAGDLVITEVMSNPDVVDDAAGEYFEVLVTGAGDLNGLQAGKGGTLDGADVVVSGENCVEATPGEYRVFARSDDAAVNGGLPQVDHLFDFALNNSGADLLIGFEGVVWDEVTWASRTAGASLSVDPGSANATDNDLAQNWCDGVGVYGDGDQGTPGSVNASCGGALDECIDPDTDLPRALIPPMAGDVVITEIMPNPDAVGDADGEWFELRITDTLDLNGLQIGKDDVFTVTVTEPDGYCIELGAGDFAVIVRNADDNANGMIPNVTAQASISLSNSNSNLQVGYDGQLLSQASWVSSPAGVAHSQDPDSLEFCGAVDPYGLGDLGTPGAANPNCDGGGGGDGQCFDIGMNMMRAIVPPVAGDVVITEIMANPAAVSDANGEWFEVRALADFDLNEVEFGKLFADGVLLTVMANDCITLAAGDTALLARNPDTMTNGGLPAIDYEFDFSLNNTNSGLFVGHDGALLDAVTWSSVSSGSSTSLDPDAYDPDTNDDANVGGDWCYADVPFGVNTDNGSPDADNQQCL